MSKITIKEKILNKKKAILAQVLSACEERFSDFDGDNNFITEFVVYFEPIAESKYTGKTLSDPELFKEFSIQICHLGEHGRLTKYARSISDFISSDSCLEDQIVSYEKFYALNKSLLERMLFVGELLECEVNCTTSYWYYPFTNYRFKKNGEWDL